MLITFLEMNPESKFKRDDIKKTKTKTKTKKHSINIFLLLLNKVNYRFP